MPTVPPGNEPSLPQLRRFRFSPDTPNIAHEVDAEGKPIAAAVQPAKRADSPARSTAEADLREVDRLLAQLDGSAVHRSGARRAAQSPADDRAAARDAAEDFASTSRPRPRTSATGPTGASGPGSTSVGGTKPPSTPAGGTIHAPATGPSRPTAAARVRRRSPWLYALAGLAAALVIGLVAWMVLTPGGAGRDGRGTEQAASGGGSEVREWAAGMCQALTEFQTAAMPLRADAAKAKAADSGEASVMDLQREASQLLTTLAGDLQAVGLPAGSEQAATAHKTVVSAANAAATSAQGGGDSPVGTDDAVAAVLGALDRPVTIFAEVVADLPSDERAAVTAEQSCAPLL